VVRDLNDNGTAGWAPGSGNQIGVGWQNFIRIFPGSDPGEIYAVEPSGNLLGYRDLARDGSNGAGGGHGWDHSSGRTIGEGWNEVLNVFPGPNGGSISHGGGTYDWNTSGTNSAIAQNWEALAASRTIYWHVRVDTNWAALFNAVIKAAGDLSKLINLDGPDTDDPPGEGDPEAGGSQGSGEEGGEEGGDGGDGGDGGE
jgi:hypothetical protein